MPCKKNKASNILKAWRFPDDFVQSLATHHDDPTIAKAALTRALIAGEALTRVALDGAENDPAIIEVEAEALALARIDAESAPALATQVRKGGEELSASLRAV